MIVQYVMKSDKACSHMIFQNSCMVDMSVLHKLRAQRKKEKSDMGNLVLTERRKLQRQDTGMYIDEIVKEMDAHGKFPF